MSTFQDLTRVTTQLVAAGDHLLLRGLTADSSCGCPGRAPGVDHDDTCPARVIDQTLEAGSRLSHVMASMAADTGSITFAQARDALTNLDPDEAPFAAAAVTLALVGAARLSVTIATRTVNAEHDFIDPLVERYAVLHRVTYDPSVRLVAETCARLLLSPHRLLDLERLTSRMPTLDGTATTAERIDLGALVPVLLEATDSIMASLPAPGLPNTALNTLIVEGFNMLAGVEAAASSAGPTS